LNTLFYTFKTNGPVLSVKLRQLQNAANRNHFRRGIPTDNVADCFGVPSSWTPLPYWEKGNEMTTEWKVTRLKGRFGVGWGGGHKGKKQNATIEVGVSQVPCTKDETSANPSTVTKTASASNTFLHPSKYKSCSQFL